MSPKVLLTSVFRPFSTNNKYNLEEGDKFLDFFSKRLSVESGLFPLHDNHPTVPLYLIAANIDAQVTILETPTLDEYKAELQKGYDVLGITFYTFQLPKIMHMIAMARKFAPRTRVVIGGFGTALSNLEDLDVDGISKGEGVRFMRSFLNQDTEAPLVHPVLTFDIRLRLAVQYPELGDHKCGIIVNGFGCPHGCDFCTTSAYYGRKHIPFIKSGAQLYALMQHYEKAQGVRDFLIYEEDFLIYNKFVKEFIKCTKASDNNYSWGCFATVKALSKYDLTELVKSGLSHVWVGVESVKSPFAKSHGKPIAEIMDELNAHGITTTGSIIAGLDHHTAKIMYEEYDHLASLHPSTVQISSLIAGPGTALRKHLKEENRLIETVDIKESTLYSETIRHPAFDPGELKQTIFKGYEYIYQKIGPTLLRMLETWFSGYQTLHSSPDPLLNLRSQILKKRILSVRPIFYYTLDQLPNANIRGQTQALLKELEGIFGGLDDPTTKKAEMIGRCFAAEHERRMVEGLHIYEPDTRSYYLLSDIPDKRTPVFPSKPGNNAVLVHAL